VAFQGSGSVEFFTVWSNSLLNNEIMTQFLFVCLFTVLPDWTAGSGCSPVMKLGFIS